MLYTNRGRKYPFRHKEVDNKTLKTFIISAITKKCGETREQKKLTV